MTAKIVDMPACASSAQVMEEIAAASAYARAMKCVKIEIVLTREDGKKWTSGGKEKKDA